MPLQFLPLQQRQKQQPRSVVSEALTPQPTRKGFAEAGGTMPNRFVEEQKAKWAEEDKLKKLERDAQVNEAQEMGMRIRDAYEKEKAQGRQMSMQAVAGAQAQQQGAAKQIEANPEEAAKVSYEFLLSLPEETQEVLLKQIFAPTAPKSTMSAGGKTIPIGGEKLNAIAQSMLAKGQVTMDTSGKPVLSKPKYAEGDKWTYNATDNLMWNERTGESKPVGQMTDKDWDVIYTDIVKEAESQVKGFLSETFLEGLNADQRAGYIELEQDTMKNIIASRLWQAGMRDAKKIKQWAAAAVGKFDWEAAIKKETGLTTTTTEPTRTGVVKNWDAPLDEEKAKGFAEFLKANPNTTSAIIEANRDKYGDATVDRALEILSEEPKPTVKKTKKKEVVKKEEPKVKDYLKGMMERRGLE